MSVFYCKASHLREFFFVKLVISHSASLTATSPTYAHWLINDVHKVTIWCGLCAHLKRVYKCNITSACLPPQHLQLRVVRRTPAYSTCKRAVLLTHTAYAPWICTARKQAREQFPVPQAAHGRRCRMSDAHVWQHTCGEVLISGEKLKTTGLDISLQIVSRRFHWLALQLGRNFVWLAINHH